MTKALPNRVTLAVAFIGVINRWLSAAELKEVRRDNASDDHPTCCATHDFCDANMAMDEAWRLIYGDEMPREPHPDDDGGYTQEAMDIWNDAWDYAKRWDFDIKKVPRYAQEFPDWDDVEFIPPVGWEDTSWHHNAMPTFEKTIGGKRYRLWCDYLSVAMSRLPEEVHEGDSYLRFAIVEMLDETTQGDTFLRSSNLAMVKGALKELEKALVPFGMLPIGWRFRRQEHVVRQETAWLKTKEHHAVNVRQIESMVPYDELVYPVHLTH